MCGAESFCRDAMTRTKLRAKSPLERASIGFFVAALVLVGTDGIFWARYWQLPNYLAVIAALAALWGLVDRISTDAASPAPSSARSAERWSMFAVFSAFLAFYSVTGTVDQTLYRAHVLQAVAFLHGRTDIGYWPGIEEVEFAGRYFQLHPPLPAILLTPFVAIWGVDTNQRVFSLVTGAVDAALAWWMLGRMRLSVNARVWLTLFFGVGTVMWFETLNGGSWDISQTVAVGFTLGALGELFGEARPGFIGVLAGLSALARNDLALDFPIFVALCYVRRPNWRRMLWMAPGFAFSGVVYATMNEVRFNNIFDLGQFLFTGGTPTFARSFLPQDLNTLLFMAPRVDGSFPYIHPIASGQALTFTSPAFVLALRPKLTRSTPFLLMLGAVLAMLPSLFFHSNGAAQFGTRHYIHSFPFLLALMALGLPGRKMDQLTAIMVVVSIFFIGDGVLQISLWGFG